MKQLHVNLTNEWHDWLTDQCQRTGMTKSGFVKMLFLHFNEMEAPPQEHGSDYNQVEVRPTKWYDGMPFRKGGKR